MNCYFDYAATTPVHSEVAEVVYNTMCNCYGNPSSIYKIGRESFDVVENSRKIIAKKINSEPNEIIFTSSGSEANNLAIKGFYFNNIDNCTIITSKIEHKSILNSVMFLKKIGCDVHLIDVDSFGKINIEQLYNCCSKTSNQLLVSVQYANNEIGTIQDINRISDIVHNFNGFIHTDAVQAIPEIQVDVKRLGVDLMSVSGHKINAPKGIGFLYKRSNISLSPLIHGGKQEFGIRAGTENVPYIAGLAKAVELIDYSCIESIRKKRDYLIKNLVSIGGILNGDARDRLANNINISFKNINGEALVILLDLDDFYVSSGSACNSGLSQSSYVISAINGESDSSIRITLGGNIEYDVIDHIIDAIKKNLYKLRMCL